MQFYRQNTQAVTNILMQKNNKTHLTYWVFNIYAYNIHSAYFTHITFSRYQQGLHHPVNNLWPNDTLDVFIVYNTLFTYCVAIKQFTNDTHLHCSNITFVTIVFCQKENSPTRKICIFIKINTMPYARRWKLWNKLRKTALCTGGWKIFDSRGVIFAVIHYKTAHYALFSPRLSFTKEKKRN